MTPTTAYTTREPVAEQREGPPGNVVWTPSGGAVLDPLPEAPDSFRDLTLATAGDSVDGSEDGDRTTGGRVTR